MDEVTPRVMLVDDEGSVRLALERGLQRCGCVVVHARDGEEGLRLARESVVQVALVDLRMPGIDGHTFLRRLRAQGSNTAVIIVSGQGGMDDVVDAMRGGAVDYLKKPWSQADLVAAYGRGLDAFERSITVPTRAPAPVVSVHPPVPAAGGSAKPLQASGPAPAELHSSTAAPILKSPAPISPHHAPGPPPTERKTTLAAVLGSLKTGDIPVPAAPTVLARMRNVVSDPQADTSAVVALVSQDQRLAAEVLRLANTAQYARGGRVSDLQAAVTRLGFRQLHQMVETILLKSTFQVRLPWTQKRLHDVWQRSVATAIAARFVCETLPPNLKADPGLAYLCGLFCDVGAFFLLWLIDENAHRSGEPPEPQATLDAIEQHHQTIGRRIVETWKMDQTMQVVVATHHADPRPLTGTGVYRALVCVGGLIADRLDLPTDISFRQPFADEEGLLKVLHAMGLSPGDLLQIAEAIRPQVDAVTKASRT